ncbi:MAG TPA: RDD family protein, partial [Thermoplasmata archaeon]
ADRVSFAEEPPTSDQLLRRALTGAVEGQFAVAVRAADGAVSVAIAQTRRLLGLPALGPAGEPLTGIPAPAWVVTDRRNLGSLARSASDDPADATRAWMTGRWLVRFARGVGRRRFATRTSRGSAFAIDLVAVTAPAVLVWYGLATRTPGTSVQLLQSVALNVAALGYASFALFYFVLAERFLGTTVGKRLLGLRVTGRDLQPPGPLAAFVRNLPKTVTLTLVGYVGVVAVVLAVRGSTYTVSAGGIVSTAVSLVPLAALLLLSVGLPAAVGAVVIGATPERQRLGDLWAGTWVVRTELRAVRPSAGPPPTPPAGRPSG